MRHETMKPATNDPAIDPHAETSGKLSTRDSQRSNSNDVPEGTRQQDEARPNYEALLRFVRTIAERETCEDNRDRCTLKSGPYCGTHPFNEFDDVAVARRVLELSASISPGAEQAPAPTQQQVLQQVIAELKEKSAVNERLRQRASSQAWEMIYMDRRDIFADCARQLSALLASPGERQEQEKDQEDHAR